MTITLSSLSHIQELESKLVHQKDTKQRVVLLNELAELYAFTRVHKAQVLLSELGKILRANPEHPFQLSYHLNTAIVENQFYNHRLSEIHYKKAIEILEEEGGAKEQAEVYIDFSGVCTNLKKLDDAHRYLDKASKLLKSFPDAKLEARLACRQGYLHLEYTEYDRAIESLLSAEKLLTEGGEDKLQLKDYYFLTLIHSGLGNSYTDKEKCAESFLKVLKICEDTGMSSRLSWHYLNVGHAYMMLDEYDLAEEYLEKSLNIATDISLLARAGATANLGNCYFRKQRYEEALKLYDKAMNFYKQEDGDGFANLFTVARWKAELYSAVGQEEEGINSLIEAHGYAKDKQNTGQLALIYQDIADYYAANEDFENAYQYQQLHSEMSNAHHNERYQRKELELRVKHGAEKRRREAEMFKLEANKLQLKALRAQMNPHFMFNALNSIQDYITSNQHASAAKYLAQFAKLMRQSLEHSDIESISLEKEVEFLEDYLNINKELRFTDLDYEIKIDDEIEDDILGVPTMIIQPYVENAIEHGLRSKKNGVIKVHFIAHGENSVLCTIEDNGIGRKKAGELQAADKKYENHRSLGTMITMKRLQLLYELLPLDHDNVCKNNLVKTTDLVDPKTGQACGTKVEMCIPIVEIKMK